MSNPNPNPTQLPTINAKIVNLTPHALKIMSEDCSTVLAEIPSSGAVRAKQTRKPIAKINIDGITATLVRTEYGEVEGLPDPQPGVLYAVSTIAAMAIKQRHPERNDIIVPDTGPGSVCRDDKGQIKGVRYLIKP